MKVPRRVYPLVVLILIVIVVLVLVEQEGLFHKETLSSVRIGVWSLNTSQVWEVTNYPDDTVVFEATTGVVKSRAGLSVFVHGGWWFSQTWHPGLPVTTSVVKSMFSYYSTMPMSDFDGVNFLGEEVYPVNINFEDGTNVTWLGGERLLGYDLWGSVWKGSVADWQDEMYFKMLRGFAVFFHQFGKQVGITTGGPTIMMGDYITPEGNYTLPNTGPNFFFGKAGWNYILQSFDYVIVYDYPQTLNEFVGFYQSYLAAVDALPSRLKKYGILTRSWGWTTTGWEDGSPMLWQRDVRALEMKAWLDRGIVATTYEGDGMVPPVGYSFEEAFSDMEACVRLYNAHQPFYESIVYGKNLMTNVTGYTYGFVKV